MKTERTKGRNDAYPHKPIHRKWSLFRRCFCLLFLVLFRSLQGCCQRIRIGLCNWISECFQTDLCTCAVTIAMRSAFGLCNPWCEKFACVLVSVHSLCFRVCAVHACVCRLLCVSMCVSAGNHVCGIALCLYFA